MKDKNTEDVIVQRGLDIMRSKARIRGNGSFVDAPKPNKKTKRNAMPKELMQKKQGSHMAPQEKTLFISHDDSYVAPVSVEYIPSHINEYGVEKDSALIIKSDIENLLEVKSVIEPILDYHEIDAILDYDQIVISDAEHLLKDGVDAIELAVKGLNQYLK